MLWPLGVAEAYGAEPVIPVRRDSGLRVWFDDVG